MTQLTLGFKLMTKREFDKQPIQVLRLGKTITNRLLDEGIKTLGKLYTFWKNSGDFVSGEVSPKQSNRIVEKYAAYQREHPECYGWQDEVWN